MKSFFISPKKPELLSGVGDFPSLIAAVLNGCDAVYFGIKGFNMRDLGTNFSINELDKLMKYLHSGNPGKKNVLGFLALNTIVFDDELKKVDTILRKAKKARVDGVIVSDLAVLGLAKKHGLEIHLSTQASVSNSLALEHFVKLGVKRVVLARELSLEQIKLVAKKAHKLKAKIECFVHGAMCISVSGRCFLSHDAFGRSANRGECLQPCRRAFFLDGSAPNFEKKEIYLEGSTVLSAKDLKTIQFLDKLVLAGIDCFKIEGRTKPSEYVAVTTKCYREAIDSVFDRTFSEGKISKWNSELKNVYNRGFSDGFYFSVPSGKDLAEQQGSIQSRKRINVGVVTKYYAKIGVAEVKLFDSVSLGDKLLFEGTTTFLEQPLDSMQINLKPVKSASQGEHVGIKVTERVRVNDKVFVFTENRK
jgi:putative protease